MNYVINYLKALIIPLSVILVAPLILAILNLMGLKTYHILVLIVMLITALISGLLVGRKLQKRGYLNGLILGIVLCFILLILGLFGKNHYGLNTFIYYLIIIIGTTFGSMIGVQKKVTD